MSTRPAASPTSSIRLVVSNTGYFKASNIRPRILGIESGGKSCRFAKIRASPCNFFEAFPNFFAIPPIPKERLSLRGKTQKYPKGILRNQNSTTEGSSTLFQSFRETGTSTSRATPTLSGFKGFRSPERRPTVLVTPSAPINKCDSKIPFSVSTVT